MSPFCLLGQSKGFSLLASSNHEIEKIAQNTCFMLQVRSNHERLVALSNDSGKEKMKDSPLKLKSTAEWKQRGIAVCRSQSTVCSPTAI